MPGENEYWRRPGKDKGWSATLKDRVFYVFSSSAATDVDLSGFMVSEGPKSLRRLVESYPSLRRPVIEGLLREGESIWSFSGKTWKTV